MCKMLYIFEKDKRMDAKTEIIPTARDVGYIENLQSVQNNILFHTCMIILKVKFISLLISLLIYSRFIILF